MKFLEFIKNMINAVLSKKTENIQTVPKIPIDSEVVNLPEKKKPEAEEKKKPEAEEKKKPEAEEKKKPEPKNNKKKEESTVTFNSDGSVMSRDSDNPNHGTLRELKKFFSRK